MLFNYILKESRMLLLRHISLVISCAYLPAALAGFPCTYVYICILLALLIHRFIIYIFFWCPARPLFILFCVLLVKNLCMSLLIYEQRRRRPVARYLRRSFIARLKNSAFYSCFWTSGSSALFPSLVFPKGCSNQRR